MSASYEYEYTNSNSYLHHRQNMMPIPISEAHLHQLKRSYRPKSLGYRATVITTFTTLVLYLYCFNWVLNATKLASPPHSRASNSDTIELQETRGAGELSLEQQTAPELIQKIRNDWLKPPPSLDFNETNVSSTGSHKTSHQVRVLSQLVQRLMRNQTNGVFFEIYALDGYNYSTTLDLEVKLNWTGILAEPDPKFYSRLRKRQRRAWTINACISAVPKEETIIWYRRQERGGGQQDRRKSGKSKRRKFERIQVHCFPFFSVLTASAVAVYHPYVIDYLSLRVESAKIRLLQSIPWHKVYIKIISIEAGTGRRSLLEKFLRNKGYILLPDGLTSLQDLVFVQEKYWNGYEAYFKTILPIS